MVSFTHQLCAEIRTAFRRIGKAHRLRNLAAVHHTHLQLNLRLLAAYDEEIIIITVYPYFFSMGKCLAEINLNSAGLDIVLMKIGNHTGMGLGILFFERHQCPCCMEHA